MPIIRDRRYLQVLAAESETAKIAIEDGNEDGAYRHARAAASLVLQRARENFHYARALVRAFGRKEADRILAIKRCYHCVGQLRYERVYPEKGRIAYVFRCRKCGREP